MPAGAREDAQVGAFSFSFVFKAPVGGYGRSLTRRAPSMYILYMVAFPRPIGRRSEALSRKGKWSRGDGRAGQKGGKVASAGLILPGPASPGWAKADRL